MTNYTLNFDDDIKIESSRSACVQEMEPLFWKLEDSLYDGDKEHAEVLFEMFLYMAKYNPGVFLSLRKKYRDRLKQITYELYDDTVPTRLKTITMQCGIGSKNIPFKQEKDLRKFLASHISVVRAAIARDIELVGQEVDTDFEFKCDLVVATKDLFFPIELKIVQASHKVVSQIDKYCFYFYRQLRYNFYKDIQGVVVANGYDDWSINQLRRAGHWIYDIEPDDTQVVRLRRII
jgi:RecB family endonuclease NucS